MIATRPAPFVLQDGSLDPACRVVDPKDDQVYLLWWSLVYRDGTERRQYAVHGGHLIQTMFGLLSPLYIRQVQVWNGPPWAGRPEWAIQVPPGAEVDIHYDTTITLASDTPFAKVKRSGTIVLPTEPERRFKVRKDQVYTFGWFDIETKRGEFLHFDMSRDPVQAWQDNRRFV